METVPEEKPKLLKVGELARICHKSVRALRLYEELGLLEPGSRSKGGFRLYPRAAIGRIEWIGKLQDMGLSLTDIQQLLEDWATLNTASRAMNRLRQLLTKRMELINGQLARLQSLQQEMKDSLRFLEKCRDCDAETPSRCTRCNYDRAPMLIAQFHRPGTGEHPRIPDKI
jgi:DNA-binding transcriptional MerR regulator